MRNRELDRRYFIGTLAALALPVRAVTQDSIELFDGHSMNGWRPSEHKSSWTVADGMLAANGPRSHLFYDGPVHGADFKNFELEVELTTRPECNSGIYFHTTYQESGFPEKGFEVQINNTALGDNGYLERKKTGSLYGLRNIYMQLVPDDKPFRVRVAVRGKNVRVHLNGQLLVDYVEPTPPVIPAGGESGRFLSRGTFALQCHYNGSRAFYRSIRVRPLPDDLPEYTATAPQPVVDETYRDIINIGRHNVPMVDYHVYLRDGITVEDALRRSREDGIEYGITASSGSIKSDDAAQAWLKPLLGKPAFFAFDAGSGSWKSLLSKETARRFDYILAESRVWTSLNGRPVRLWVPGEANAITEPQKFLDSLIEQTVERLNTEPVDIYTHPTYLPESLRGRTDELWTEPRMSKLIDALLKNKVAVEINTLDRLPGKAFLDRAKQAGCRFGFGTANQTAAELKRCEYGLEMVHQCNLDWRNFYAPGSWWPKAADRA